MGIGAGLVVSWWGDCAKEGLRVRLRFAGVRLSIDCFD